MGVIASSWEAKTTAPDRVASVLGQAVTSVRSATGALVFVSGTLAERLGATAEAIAALRLPFPIGIAAGAGVMTERGEIEGQSAAAGVVWSGGKTELVTLAGAGDEIGESLARVLADQTGKTAPTVLCFVRPDGFGPTSLNPLGDLRGTRHVLGAGTAGNPGAAALFPDGRVVAGSIAMILRGLGAPAIGSAHSARLLSPLKTITACRGALVAGIDGEPALDVLASHGEKLRDRPLVLVVLADETDDGSGRPALLVRGIQGVDPDRRAIVVSDEIHEGMRIAFAIRDPRAARDDFEAMTRELERGVAGAAPRFGVVMNCAGRGSGLYGTHDVDTKLLRTRFPRMPFAGLASTFEIAPHGGKPTLQLYTGVVAVFTSPS